MRGGFIDAHGREIAVGRGEFVPEIEAGRVISPFRCGTARGQPYRPVIGIRPVDSLQSTGITGRNLAREIGNVNVRPRRRPTSLVSPAAVFRRLVIGAILYRRGHGVFLAFPQVDQAASGLFYDTGADLGGVGSAVHAAQGTWPFSRVKLVAVRLGVLVVAAAVPRLPDLLSCARRCSLSTLALGPGVVVNAVFKNNWGRPAPERRSISSAATRPYVEVWRISDYCERNCSFVSGEASSGLWLVTLAFLAPRAGASASSASFCRSAWRCRLIRWPSRPFSPTRCCPGHYPACDPGALSQLFYRSPPGFQGKRRWRGFSAVAVALRRACAGAWQQRSLIAGRRFARNVSLGIAGQGLAGGSGARVETWWWKTVASGYPWDAPGLPRPTASGKSDTVMRLRNDLVRWNSPTAAPQDAQGDAASGGGALVAGAQKASGRARRRGILAVVRFRFLAGVRLVRQRG
ncbi:MAG: hypothetical protein HPM95_11575 [Alphaproteobacteria bacterium]|nr:hypothetical protein [Alphaproteobacteria bacterium]